MKSRYVLIACVLALLVSVFTLSLSLGEVAADGEVIAITAQQLDDEYDANPIGAESKYAGRILEVLGTIRIIGEDYVGAYVILQPWIHCRFDNKADPGLLEVVEGQLVKVQGECLAGDSPKLEHSTVVWIGEVIAADGGDGSCFIATAAYGTSTTNELDTLRSFRDEVLLRNSLGSRFVGFYYENSPPLADFISKHDVLRTIVRELVIDPIVWVAKATEHIWRN